ncbi:MAG: SMC family ATPase [Fusobacteriaceae bacterium]|jgi:exonuclease SbcC|nr:SMC family ATPase [Fusobacteriaceae bacterium]
MKPICLEISAFGPYPGKEIIDFTVLGETGLYLITGETGSGKTTVFDAVSFALYGEASGQLRSKSMLRSDFADPETKSYVALDFSSGGKKYTIRRDIDKTASVLTLPDGSTVSKEKAVGAKITEIIGLNHDQFAQIVMIAQNDFLRFLQSKVDDRLNILRRIFGTEKLKDFQNRLKEKANVLSHQLENIRRDFEKFGVETHGREETFREWTAQIEKDSARLRDLELRLEQNAKVKESLAKNTALATALHKLFEDLTENKNKMTAHAAKAHVIQEKKSRVERGKKALHMVKPLADNHAKAVLAANEAEKRRKLACDEEKSAREKLSLTEDKRKALSDPAQAAEALAKRRSDWEKADEKHKKLQKLKTDYDVVIERARKLKKEQERFTVLEKEYDEADREYRQKNMAFLRNQAGIMAATLTPGAPCPVCGSLSHPNPAILTEADVTETAVKAAQTTLEKLRGKREEKALECGNLRTEIQVLKEAFLLAFSDFSTATSGIEIKNELFSLLDEAKADASFQKTELDRAEKALEKLKTDWETVAAAEEKAKAAHAAASALIREREETLQKEKLEAEQAGNSLAQALKENGFADETAYARDLLSEKELSLLEEEIADYRSKGDQLKAEELRLSGETAGKEKPDMDQLRELEDQNKKESRDLQEARDAVKGSRDRLRDNLALLQSSAKEYGETEEQYRILNQLSATANGKLDFETYAQMAYFEHVLRAANQRLSVMSQNRYTLVRKKVSSDGRQKFGLDIEVFDAYTQKSRPSASLSGGESFMASLSLALGLSDIVQQNAGGFHLDAMFIDEGFGTLDAEVLDLAIKTLSEMAGGGRTIGIISHVAELRERIDKQIRIKKTAEGSRIEQIS